MAIAPRAGGTAQGKAVTTLSTAGFNCQTNDAIVVTLANKGTITTNAPTDTIGNVYAIHSSVANGTTCTEVEYTAISIGSNASNVVTATSTSNTYTVTAESYSGVVAIGPTNSGTTGTGTSVTAAGIITDDPNDWIVMGAASNGTATYSATAPNVVEQTIGTSGGGASTNMHGAIGDGGAIASAGSLPTITFTLSASQVWASADIELRSVVPLGVEDIWPIRFQVTPYAYG